ncbi:YdbH domain-containing protein [Brevundimonas sp.]|uniref:intermembrane phospholipid transport protein YdbH family protein n=1 Tax=Brevundimonas sp. TaxID=1871086 RepID=UPI0025F2410F|nr:YdbH domain-containing protein [Brevundimonas sp.]
MAAGAIVGLLLALLVIAYAARREAARQVLTDWLEDRGVEAEVQFQELDFDGLVASLRAGPADDPDLVVERIEVDYALGAPWAGGFSVTPSRIRVVRPQVKATLTDGEISFGSLDPVIEEFLDRPPSDEEGGPLILIEDATARLITRGGDLRATGDARLDDGRLVRADIVLPAARLRDEAIDLDLTSGRLTARAEGDRLVLNGSAEVEAIRGLGMTGRAAELGFVLNSPYPDTRLRRADGTVRARMELSAAEAGWDGGEADALQADLTFDGQAEGWLDVFSLDGRLDGTAGAGGLNSGDLSLSRVRADLNGERFRIGRGEALTWRYDGAARVAAGGLRRGDIAAEGLMLSLSEAVAGGGPNGTELTADAGLTAVRFSQDELSLLGVTGAFDLDATFTGASLVTLRGGVRSRGGSWPILGAPRAEDIPEQADLKRAFGAFALDAPGLTLRTGSPGTTLFLTRPARVTPASGGQVVIETREGQPLYAARPGESGGGAFALTATGGGLPDAQVQVIRYDMGRGITARIDGRAELDFVLARDVSLTTAGRLEIGGGRTDYFAGGCAPFTAALLELGENDVHNLSASLCPPDGPMLTIADGWRFRSQAREVWAEAPFLGMGVTEATGLITAADRGSGLTATADVASAIIYDTQEPTRFNPMRGTGRVTLANEVWDGAFEIADRVHGADVADLTLRHDGRSGAGGLIIDARGVTFAPEGLQPADLSPFAERVAQSQASGAVDFTGGFRWNADGATSSGVLSTEGLDFVSPAGPVTRLRGEVEFISLAPLTTAPAQRLRVERIDAFLPLLSAEVEFDLNADRLRLADGRVETAGGSVSIEPLEIPLDASEAYEGVLILENVQLGELIGRSGFADRVQLDAVVSGRLPFVMGPDGVTFIEGRITAVQPGRLAIGREALTGLQAEGGGEAVPPNAVQDFAYQAMENLSFDTLDATINSLPQGRLGVLFTIHGRHDPPQHQEIRLTLSELIQREFMNRQLPLPSGTEINLTLDTSLNLDQFISDLMELQRARNGDR